MQMVTMVPDQDGRFRSVCFPYLRYVIRIKAVIIFISFLQNFERVGLLTSLWCVQGLRLSPNLDVFLWSLYLALDGFFAASPLISDCSALWNSEKVMEFGVSATRNGEQKGLHAQESHRALLSIITMAYFKLSKCISESILGKRYTHLDLKSCCRTAA